IRRNAVAPFAATRVTESIKPANDAQAAYQGKALRVPAFYVARLVSFLASDAASHVSGQLFGARGRELFVFSQPRPAQRLLQPHGGFELAAFGAAARALEPGSCRWRTCCTARICRCATWRASPCRRNASTPSSAWTSAATCARRAKAKRACRMQ